ncbi:LOW QUALITY PROTEIN: phospholipid-transporting ATPase ABCA3 [Drosophila rhopaloa]|uniref:ABC transporter domain-containing protein n=1 Tax=Drosophila rhopaloa TaxID=1041015 RepID=A0ABM5J8G6_DRORH|nr:LOW QUALITY PROTEIN: phospholipid-transporting ATPase ABCA3 [Drosophila rhopaloa]
MQRNSTMSRNLTFCQKYQLLLWKDMKIQFANVVEFIMIILLAALMPLLISIGTKVAKSMFPFDIELEKGPDPKSVKTSLFKELYFTPYNGLIEKLVFELANITDFTHCESFDETEELYLKMLKNQKAVGIEFPPEWDYFTTLPDTLNFTLYMPVYIKSSSFKYFESGFLLMQEQLSQIFIKWKSKGRKNITSVRMNHFPYPRYVPNHYSESAKVMAYMSIVSFFLPCITIAKYIVAEKEYQQKAILNAMGFRNSIHWFAWYTKSMVLLLLCVLIMISIFATGMIYEFSNLLCLFVVLLVYIHSLVFFAFFVSSLCSRSYWAVVIALLLYAATVIPFVIVGTKRASLAAQTAACFGLNSALFYILHSVATMEAQSVGIQWYTMAKTASYGHKLSIVVIMLIMFAISWIELLICLYIEEVRPGEFGVPHPWYYPCQKRYWCPHRFVPPLLPKSRNLNFPLPFGLLLPNPDDQRPTGSIQKRPKDKKIGVEIRNLNKTFGHREVVKNLTFNMYENEITALLGHNGAGKTTTILMLCGMLPPTSGTALINGYDIVRDRMIAKSNLGICLQRSVLFKGLSVSDHIYFFSRLKGYTKKEASIEADVYISKLHLTEFKKLHALKLSAGNQRRLSLACALCGGSKVIFCDEPSSGLDQMGRHDLWRLLQKEKFGRTVLMTTHLMEEGEILGDRIAIMCEGQLHCYGTLRFLKQSQNTSYTLSCAMGANCKVDKVTELVTRYVPTATSVVRGLDVNYKLPRNKIDKFSELFRELEHSIESLDIIDFGLSDSSLEEIFLSLHSDRLVGGADPGDEERSDFGGQTEFSKRSKVKRAKEAPTTSRDKSQLEQEPEPERKKVPRPKRLPEPRKPPESKPTQIITVPKERLRPMIRRKVSCTRQLQAMMIKKANYTVNHIFIFLLILIIPLIYFFIVLGTTDLAKDIPRKKLPIVLPLSLDYYNYDDMIILLDVNNKLYEKEGNAYVKLVKSPATVQKKDSIFSYIIRASPLIRRDINRKFVCGASFDNESAITAWFNSDAFEHSAPIAMNLVYNALGKVACGNRFGIVVNRGQLEDHSVKYRRLGKHKYKRQDSVDYEKETKENEENRIVRHNVSVSYNTLADSETNNLLIHQMSIAESATTLFNETDSMKRIFGGTIVTTVYLALALSIFVVFVTEERVQQMKLQQEIQGLTPFIFWLTHFFWDYLIFFIFMLALTIALYQSTIWYQVLVIFLFIGFACLPFIYLCSLMFTKPATAFAVNFTVHVVTGGILLTCVYLLRFSVSSEDVFLIFAIFPMYVGAFGLFKCLSLQEYCGRELLPPINELKCRFGSGNVFCACQEEYKWADLWLLLIHGFMWFFFLWITCFSREISHICTSSKSNRIWDDESDKHGRVLDEEQRVADIPKYDHEDYPLIVDQVKKNYCRTKAVNLVSFALEPGDCFGLLGANGAGKSTMFRMIVGETSMTGGNIYVKGYSMREHMTSAMKNVGYCPQFDTLHSFLTGRQTLKIFCLLRGVPKYHLNWVSERLAYDFGFRDQLDKKIHTYSGGTKRKLTTALAVNGGWLVCLDEPNNGVDLLARHFLWQKLETVVTDGRAVLLTTQNVEDVNALCTRVGLLVSGELTCIGSVQQVRSEVSHIMVLGIQVKVKNDPQAQKEVLETVMAEIDNLFPASLLQEALGNSLRYHIYKSDTTWSNLFYQMELKRNDGKLEDYSITQASLDEILMELNNEEFNINVDSDSSVDMEEVVIVKTNKKKFSNLDITKFEKEDKQRKKTDKIKDDEGKKERELKRKNDKAKGKGKGKEKGKDKIRRPASSSESTDSDIQ